MNPIIRLNVKQIWKTWKKWKCQEISQKIKKREGENIFHWRQLFQVRCVNGNIVICSDSMYLRKIIWHFCGGKRFLCEFKSANRLLAGREFRLKWGDKRVNLERFPFLEKACLVEPGFQLFVLRLLVSQSVVFTFSLHFEFHPFEKPFFSIACN